MLQANEMEKKKKKKEEDCEKGLRHLGRFRRALSAIYFVDTRSTSLRTLIANVMSQAMSAISRTEARAIWR